MELFISIARVLIVYGMGILVCMIWKYFKEDLEFGYWVPLITDEARRILIWPVFAIIILAGATILALINTMVFISLLFKKNFKGSDFYNFTSAIGWKLTRILYKE